MVQKELVIHLALKFSTKAAWRQSHTRASFKSTDGTQENPRNGDPRSTDHPPSRVCEKIATSICEHFFQCGRKRKSLGQKVSEEEAWVLNKLNAERKRSIATEICMWTFGTSKCLHWRPRTQRPYQDVAPGHPSLTLPP